MGPIFNLSKFRESVGVILQIQSFEVPHPMRKCHLSLPHPYFVFVFFSFFFPLLFFFWKKNSPHSKGAMWHPSLSFLLSLHSSLSFAALWPPAAHTHQRPSLYVFGRSQLSFVEKSSMKPGQFLPIFGQLWPPFLVISMLNDSFLRPFKVVPIWPGKSCRKIGTLFGATTTFQLLSTQTMNFHSEPTSDRWSLFHHLRFKV